MFVKLTKESVSTISVLTNLTLGLLKVGLGSIAKSSALVAEGLHSVIDCASSGITFIGIKIARRKPSQKHPYGWARAEVLAGLGVTFFLGLAGLGIIREAAASLLGGDHDASITLLPLLVMLVSIAANELLARLKLKIGQKEESLALIADGKHSRVDVYSSGAALAGLILARFFPIADSLTALAVGLYVLYETIDLGKEIGENLLDVADLEIEKDIRKICKKEQINLTGLKTRKIGSLSLAELEISVPAEVKVERVDDLISELQQKLIDQISRLEYIVVQIKGHGKRSRMLRDRCAETLERIGPDKRGSRVITPFKDGKPYDDFGAPEYLVVDRKDNKEVLREVVKNPYYKIGRGHGVRFAQAVQADEVKTTTIGENAKQALKNLKISVSIE